MSTATYPAAAQTTQDKEARRRRLLGEAYMFILSLRDFAKPTQPAAAGEQPTGREN